MLYPDDFRVTESQGFRSLVHRYYDPATGQFLSVDPLVAATNQPFVYSGDDPLNESDPTGLVSGGICGWLPGCGTITDIQNKASSNAKEAAHLAIDYTTDPYYLLYWGSFEASAKINKFGCSIGESSCIAAHIFSLPFVPGEVTGLAIDAGGDWLKSQFIPYPAGVCDEQLATPQWLLGSQAGPKLDSLFGWNWKVTFPGIHPNGQIDFQW